MLRPASELSVLLAQWFLPQTSSQIGNCHSVFSTGTVPVMKSQPVNDEVGCAVRSHEQLVMMQMQESVVDHIAPPPSIIGTVVELGSNTTVLHVILLQIPTKCRCARSSMRQSTNRKNSL